MPKHMFEGRARTTSSTTDAGERNGHPRLTPRNARDGYSKYTPFLQPTAHPASTQAAYAGGRPVDPRSGHATASHGPGNVESCFRDRHLHFPFRSRYHITPWRKMPDHQFGHALHEGTGLSFPRGNVLSTRSRAMLRLPRRAIGSWRDWLWPPSPNQTFDCVFQEA